MSADIPMSHGQLYSWREIETYPPDWLHEANLGTVWGLEGLTLETATAALRRLVERNEALRTTYHLRDDVPLQRVHDGVAPPVEHVDRFVPDRADAEHTKHALIAEPIPMTDSFGWRGSLVSTDGEPRYLALAFSHTIVDAWSVQHLRDQFKALVADPAAAPPTGPSPRELAVRQHDGTHPADRYWRRILADEPPMSRLPVLPAGATRHRIEATLHSRRLGALATQAAAQLGVTAPAVIMAFVAAGLARHTGTDRVTIDLVSHNRFEPDLERAVGTLDQLIPVPMTVDGAATIAEHVKRTHWAAAKAYRYSCYDFDRVAQFGSYSAAKGGYDALNGCWFNHLFRSWFSYRLLDRVQPDRADESPARLEWTPVARRYGQPFDVRVTVRDGQTSVALRTDPEAIPADALVDILHTVALGAKLAATEPETSVKDLASTRANPLPAALFPTH